MKTKIYKANQRGHADYGWLQANYSFSFANYRDANKVQFGALRVLNDDFIKGGGGFSEHPHHNMEIISIPLQGGLKHRDSMSNAWLPLLSGEVQVMSAGTGVMHSERNNSATEMLNLFQIWIIPDKNGVTPAYDQKTFLAKDRKDTLQLLVDSYKDAGEEVLKIHQDARISRIDLSSENTFTYTLKSPHHGVYIMLISGKVLCDEFTLQTRDAAGIWQTDSFSLKAEENADILFIEVPMIY
jgi:redox-sensitive bicupin YhaK (pirin superfamily)